MIEMLLNDQRKNCFHVLKRLLEDMFHQNKFVKQEKDSRKQESNSEDVSEERWLH